MEGRADRDLAPGGREQRQRRVSDAGAPPYKSFLDDHRPQLRFHYRAIEHLLGQILAEEAHWDAFFEHARIKPVLVLYENFAADYEASTRNVLERLGLDLPEGHELQPRMQQAVRRDQRRLDPSLRRPEARAPSSTSCPPPGRPRERGVGAAGHAAQHPLHPLARHGRYVQPYGFAVPTPNIQLLADQGVLFREAFCAMPTCSGSRACLLTGQGGVGNGMLGLAHRGWRLHDYGHHLVHPLRAARATTRP